MSQYSVAFLPSLPHIVTHSGIPSIESEPAVTSTRAEKLRSKPLALLDAIFGERCVQEGALGPAGRGNPDRTS